MPRYVAALSVVLLLLISVPLSAAPEAWCRPKHPKYDPQLCGATTTTTAPPTTTTVAPTTASTTTTTVAPTTTTQPPTTTTTQPSVAYPAQPAAGKVYWGAAIDGNAPAAYHEDACACVMSLHRTFFQWTHRTGYMIDTARADITAGRLPWISIKTPPWSEMAAGIHDAAIDEMLRALDALPGPVWLTVWHEPENDPGLPSDHVGMNRRVRQRMTALGTDNIALVVILMSWTWDARSGRNPSVWWEPGIYDLLGVDHYTDLEVSLIDPVWLSIRQWAAARNVDVAVGEWGMRGTDAAAGQRVRDWYNHAANSHQDSQGARVVGLAAFDSALNVAESYELQGEQLTAFRQLLTDPRTANIR